MSEPKHTLGPWAALVYGAYARSNSDLFDIHLFEGSDDNDLDHETMEANANLIATAPELLQALEWAFERINSKCPHSAQENNSEYNLRMMALVKQTITKARGRNG